MSGSLSPIYVLSLLGIAVYWLVQVAGLAQRGQWPRLGFLMPLGIAALLGAPEAVLYVPALFGVGLGFALIASYYPLPVQGARPTQRTWIIALLTLLLGVETLSSARSTQDNLLLLLSVAALLYSLALLLSAWLYPRSDRQWQAAITPPPPAKPQRWQRTLSADPPDLELTLDVHQARLLNISPYAVEVLGWSPARHNAWYQLRQSNGQVAPYLPSGQTGYLIHWKPLEEGNRGLRVWYTRTGSPDVYLFRADWQEPHHRERPSEQRVLN